MKTANCTSGPCGRARVAAQGSSGSPVPSKTHTTSWPAANRNRPLRTAHWKLETRLAARSPQPAAGNWQPAAGNWKPEAGSRKLDAGSPKLTAPRCSSLRLTDDDDGG